MATSTPAPHKIDPVKSDGTAKRGSSNARVTDILSGTRASGLVVGVLVLPALYRLFQASPFNLFPTVKLEPGLNATELNSTQTAWNDTTTPLATVEEPRGADRDYKVQVVSHSPLAIYLEQFVNETERAELIKVCDDAGLWARSTVTTEDENEQYATQDSRTSETCYMPTEPDIVQRIGDRAMHFLGFLPYIGLESLQLVRYDKSQEFRAHVDTFNKGRPDPVYPDLYYNRLASFFIYLADNCTDGQTYFPHIPPPPEHERSNKFTTSEEYGGFMVNPIAGNGMFWVGLTDDDEPDDRTLHAGLPVSDGLKIGLNIWVRKTVDNPNHAVVEDIPIEDAGEGETGEGVDVNYNDYAQYVPEEYQKATTA